MTNMVYYSDPKTTIEVVVEKDLSSDSIYFHHGGSDKDTCRHFLSREQLLTLRDQLNACLEPQEMPPLETLAT